MVSCCEKISRSRSLIGNKTQQREEAEMPRDTSNVDDEDLADDWDYGDDDCSCDLCRGIDCFDDDDDDFDDGDDEVSVRQDRLPWFGDDDLEQFEVLVRRRKKVNGSVAQAAEMAIRMMRSAVGSDIWCYENDLHPDSDLDRAECEQCDVVARELVVSNVYVRVSAMDKDDMYPKRTIWLTAEIARRNGIVETKKVYAEAVVYDGSCERSDSYWQPETVDVLFRNHRGATDWSGDEEDLPPAF